MIDAPSKSLGLANSPSSGWITSSPFLKTVEHLVKHTKCSKEAPDLLILDNHESHCLLVAIIGVKTNGLMWFLFPQTVPTDCNHLCNGSFWSQI